MYRNWVEKLIDYYPQMIRTFNERYINNCSDKRSLQIPSYFYATSERDLVNIINKPSLTFFWIERQLNNQLYIKIARRGVLDIRLIDNEQNSTAIEKQRTYIRDIIDALQFGLMESFRQQLGVFKIRKVLENTPQLYLDRRGKSIIKTIQFEVYVYD